jgi:hypothetical protein
MGIYPSFGCFPKLMGVFPQMSVFPKMSVFRECFPRSECFKYNRDLIVSLSGIWS